jgi:TNF receptor-associated factor 4
MEMSNFSEIHTKAWCSPSFYTHPGGYKLCLEVYGNGCGASKGVHLSAFIRLMKGEYDGSLKWPFSLNLSIMLLNQINNCNHVSHSIYFSMASEEASGRVLEGNRAKRCRGIYSFLPLADLAEDGRKKVQFLKNDSLFFKVDRPINSS